LTIDDIIRSQKSKHVGNKFVVHHVDDDMTSSKNMKNHDFRKKHENPHFCQKPVFRGRVPFFRFFRDFGQKPQKPEKPEKARTAESPMGFTLDVPPKYLLFSIPPPPPRHPIFDPPGGSKIESCSFAADFAIFEDVAKHGPCCETCE
jgi:hypothetical protein